MLGVGEEEEESYLEGFGAGYDAFSKGVEGFEQPEGYTPADAYERGYHDGYEQAKEDIQELVAHGSSSDTGNQDEDAEAKEDDEADGSLDKKRKSSANDDSSAPGPSNSASVHEEGNKAQTDADDDTAANECESSAKRRKGLEQM